jgi:hypothetical protein
VNVRQICKKRYSNKKKFQVGRLLRTYSPSTEPELISHFSIFYIINEGYTANALTMILMNLLLFLKISTQNQDFFVMV